jgi:hypothetical protein
MAGGRGAAGERITTQYLDKLPFLGSQTRLLGSQPLQRLEVEKGWLVREAGRWSLPLQTLWQQCSS